MLILGIDPGSRIVGYGLVQQLDGAKEQQYVASGCIKVGELPWSERLARIYADLSFIVNSYKPQQAAIERVFFHKNADSALKLGQARGVAIAAIASQNINIAEYSPRQLKQAVIGYGNASKSQMQGMVQQLLNLSAKPQVDAADALACALCHISHLGVR